MGPRRGIWAKSVMERGHCRSFFAAGHCFKERELLTFDVHLHFVLALCTETWTVRVQLHHKRTFIHHGNGMILGIRDNLEEEKFMVMKKCTVKIFILFSFSFVSANFAYNNLSQRYLQSCLSCVFCKSFQECRGRDPAEEEIKWRNPSSLLHKHTDRLDTRITPTISENG